MKRVRLGDIIEQIRGVSYKPEDLHDHLNNDSVILLRANNITDGKINYDNVVYVDKSKVKANQYLKKGDILICASSGSKDLVGKAAYIESDSTVTFGAFCKLIKPKIACSKYIGYYFNSSRYRTKISESSSGANINNIRNEHINMLEINFPSIETQEYIASVLDKVTDLINKRKQQMEKLDLLVKSRFIEMFGDLEINSTKFPVYPWKKVFSTKTGKLDANAMVEDGRYPFFTCAKESFLIDKYAFDCEALLLAGNNAAGIYDVKYYKGKFNAYQRTYVLQLLNEQWCYPLFKYQLEEKLQYLQHKSKGTNTRYLTLGILNDLKFIIPPVSEQNQFADFVDQVNKSKSEIQKGLEKLELLKKALMQKYFE